MFLSGAESYTTSAANIHGLIVEVENATWRTNRSSFAPKIWPNYWNIGLKYGFCSPNIWHLCINRKRFLYIGLLWAKNNLSFPTGIVDWENWIRLWGLIFRSQNFPVLHMFLKYRYWENENEFQKSERSFCSQQTNPQKPLSVYTQVSQIWRTKCIYEPPFSVV